MEKMGNSPQQEIITKENLPTILKEIGEIRETPGTSETLIPHIREVRNQVEKMGDKTTVLILLQEEFLSSQHIIMEEKAKRLHANPIRAAKGIFLMESSANAMDKYLAKNREYIDPAVGARVSRFLGRNADYKGLYSKSEQHYRNGLQFFESATKMEERINILEFRGFLSYSLIKQGKTEEGIDLAQRTLKDFDDSDEGKWLRKNDYYAWAVWKSGIEIRTAEHLVGSRVSNHVDLVDEFIKDAEHILVMPDGNTEIFGLRLKELASAKELKRNKFK